MPRRGGQRTATGAVGGHRIAGEGDAGVPRPDDMHAPQRHAPVAGGREWPGADSWKRGWLTTSAEVRVPLEPVSKLAYLAIPDAVLASRWPLHRPGGPASRHLGLCVA